MTCKDCVHYEVCYCGGYCVWNNIEQTQEDHCPYIKNKADFVEVKHGYWHLLDECANEGVYCSVCNKKVYKTDYANQKIKSSYCPNCGAKMDLKGGADNG